MKQLVFQWKNLLDDSSEYKKAKRVNRNAVEKQLTMNIKMYFWPKNVWDISCV